ncbi:MAG: type II toxin-antitoxin system RelE/ParE family toxin [Synechococcaceae cyanobacterium]|nr:type II toxin-antitoxin system RelE/ParE family toxin [Synechococcaceae cyanobacterium]
MTQEGGSPARRHKVVLSRQAVRSLAQLQRRDQQRIRAAIDLLADNPRPPRCLSLKGEEGVYRIRVGDFRILYEVFDQALVVQVIRIGHRREVYR